MQRQNNQQKQHNYRNYQGKYYTRGSSAHQPVFIPEYTEPTEPKREAVRKPKRKVFRRPKVESDIQSSHRHFLPFYAVLLTFGLCSLTIIMLTVTYSSDRARIEELRESLYAINHQNAVRQMQIYASLDIEEVEYFAINTLNMAPPGEFQVVEINVTPQSFFTHREGDTTPRANSFSFNRLWNILGRD